MTRECVSRFDKLMARDVAIGASDKRANFPDWYFRCAQLCNSVGLTDDAQRLRKEGCQVAQRVFGIMSENAFTTQTPPPWDSATLQAQYFASEGSVEEVRLAVLQAWWSYLSYSSLKRYQEQAGFEQVVPINRARPHPVKVAIAANALFWGHIPHSEDPGAASPAREIDATAALFDDLFTPEEESLIQNDLAWRLATWPDETRRDVKFARALAAAAVTRKPTDGGIRNTLGVAEYRCGDYAKAIETLTESNKLNQKREPADHYFLAMAHAMLGHAADAQEHWKAAQELVARPKQVMSAEMKRFQAEAEKVLEGAALP